jgi:hypothetical protein
LINLTTKICSALLLTPPDTAQTHIKIHEDIIGTLILGQLEPRQMTPRSKHYAVKYHWFCKHRVPQKNQLVKIAITDQLGDLRLINLKGKEFVFGGSENSNRTDRIAGKSLFA